MENNIDNGLQNPLENQVETDTKHTETLNDKSVCCCDCTKKFRINLGINILLIIALGLLFLMHFSNKTNKTDTYSNTSKVPVDYAIAYINTDTLMTHYKLYDEYKKKLENRKSGMEQEMASKARTFEKEVTDFQQKVQSYSITSDQAQKIEADLMKKQENLLALRENMSDELIEMELTHQSALFDSIINALKVYNMAYDFDYILGYSKGSGILLTNEKFDITPHIIEILNKDYEKSQKKK